MPTRWAMPPENSCGYWSRRRHGSGTRTSASSSAARLRAWLLLMPKWMRSGSAIWRPTRMAGLSTAIGSWKITPMSLPRILRHSRSLRSVTSRPSKQTLPRVMRPGAGVRPSAESIVMLLPEPDSPTTPRVSPACTSSDTPSRIWLTSPPAPGNSTSMSEIDSTASAAWGRCAGVTETRLAALSALLEASRPSESRRASPSRLKASTVSTSAPPGGTICQKPRTRNSVRERFSMTPQSGSSRLAPMPRKLRLAPISTTAPAITANCTTSAGTRLGAM